ncbi:hypothetical protein M426DRAFT_67631 [Hypoxylon sp. CI-4A]|nr:hypothetical protein M426DRAFT_67631 [Hypoxylon sp. CI-4A]
MGTYGGKPIAGAQLGNTTIKEFTPSLEGDHTSRTPSWLPYSLRWPYLAALLAFTIILEIIIITVHAVSSRESGVADDDGSSGTVVASKFVPTVLAVIHVLLISILLNDVKRTQAFANLSSPEGALVNRSLTWTADAWWDALFQGFPTRTRKATWVLLCASITFIFGFLVVSPFSSSLFVTQDINFTYDEAFSKLDLSSQLPLQAKALAPTYFRTVSNMLQNVTTSAWITDKYAVMPVWPARISSAPLGAQFADSMQSWSAKTTVFNVEESCEPMHLNGTFVSYLKNTDHVANYSSIILSASSGCSVNLTDRGTLVDNGGAVWTSLPNMTEDSTTLHWDENGQSFSKSNCPQDELLVLSTSWLDGVTSSDFTILGQACTNRYYTGDADVEVTFNDASSLFHVQINESQYVSSRVEIPGSAMNITSFQNAFLSSNWSTHLKQPSQNYVAFSAGPATLLSTEYNYVPEAMLVDPALVQNMATLKQRFFGENLRDNFDQASGQTPTSISGNTSENKRRVVVVSAVAIVLEVILGVQLLLLSAVFWMTRLSKRPLGLFSDPAPAMRMAKLIAKEPGTLRSFEPLHGSMPQEIDSTLAGQRYQIIRGHVGLVTPEFDDLNQPGSSELDTEQKMAAAQAKPQSFTLGLWVQIVLTLLLSSVLVVIAYLYWFSETYGLYQTAFVYAFDISIGGVNLRDINPASIVTTFVAVTIGLWWSSLDTTLRRIQPYLALAKEPGAGHEGLMISYISTYLLSAAWKASKRKHWVLVSVCTGAFLAEIFTIAMSSLFQRESGTIPFTVDIQRKLELRHVPQLSDATLQFTSHAGNYKQSALVSLFGNMKTSWIYGAAIQLSLNGSEPTWSSDGWSFVPHDLNGLPDTSVQNAGNNTLSGTSMNVTVQTTGIRARLECSPHEDLDITNTTSWLTEWDLTNTTQWNEDLSPDTLKTGYELGLSGLGDNTMLFLDKNASLHGNYTTFFANNKRLQCCENVTDGQIGSSSVGYWSPNLSNGTYYPDFATAWPANFTIKWIRGTSVEGYHAKTNPGVDSSSSGPSRMMWSEKPQMAALNCQPVIERADASVTVSTQDSQVIHYELTGNPVADPYAWSDDFKQHKDYEGICDHPECSNIYSINITTSHGILFMTGLLGAADLSDFAGTDLSYTTASEDISDQTFNIRQPGLNADLMTYSMLSLVDYNHDALLDPETLERTAQKAFSALFQNFASNNVSFETGGYVFQPPSEALPSDLDTIYSKRDDASSSADTVTLDVSRPVELLKMSKPAAWICMVILGYLIVVSVVLTVASRAYTKMLLRKINSLADVVVLMAGSEKLLQLAREKSLDELQRDHNIKARLGWFTGADGQARWGIELVGEEPEKPAIILPPDDNDDQQSRATSNAAAGNQRQYNADGVSLLSSMGSRNYGPGAYQHDRARHEQNLDVERASMNPSPVSQEYGLQAHRWETAYEGYSPAPPAPPHIQEHDRAPSIDINVDETPFSSYFGTEENNSSLANFRRSLMRSFKRKS